jgi:hypothetical protein
LKSLAATLRQHETIIFADLSFNQLFDVGAGVIADVLSPPQRMLRGNHSLTRLNLANCDIGPVGGAALQSALKTCCTNSTGVLHFLDVTLNNIPIKDKEAIRKVLIGIGEARITQH